jgi:LPXTG-motif cell wall-anchored protein
LSLEEKENNMNKSLIRKKLILTVVMLTLALTAAVPALAQTEPPTPQEEPKDPVPETEPQPEPTTDAAPKTEPQPEPKTEARPGSDGVIRGSITSISGAVVPVEEDPADESGSPKGTFTVTGETDILQQQNGERAPAAFDDLRVGQLVEAEYAGPVAESYPSQGTAGSIVILEPSGSGPGPAPGSTAMLAFELTVEGDPPADASFLGFIPAEGGFRAPLADPDENGVYTGSVEVPKFAPGGPPEPVSLPVQIVQTQPGAYHSRDTVLKHFGEVLIDEDKTFSASVSFDEEPNPDEIAATGVLEELESTSFQYGTHALIDGDTEDLTYALTSDSVPLEVYAGELVTIHGTLAPDYEEGADGGPPLVEVSWVETTPRDGSVTLDFELTLEGAPPADATFFGMAGVDLEDIWLDKTEQLTDPDGDGVYAGSVEVPAGRPVTVWITQGTGTHEGQSDTVPGEPFTVIKHFGTKTFYEDATFRASVSFPGNGGSGNGGPGGDSVNGTSLGGIASGIRSVLPNTGGSMTLTILGAGVLLISGGFLIRRLAQ